MEEDQIKRRTPSRGVLQARAAREIARPFSLRLGDWQSLSIKLQEMAKRQPGTDEAATMRTQIHGLLEEVDGTASEYEQKVVTLPEESREHSVIRDTRHGFALIRSRLETALAALDGSRA
ncbi:hypothetical protein [Devosia sp.]|uniref:hypothetical protein n=1 Tax=Devosia sp. TaxID=1871048 RepID=UPI003A8D089B